MTPIIGSEMSAKKWSWLAIPKANVPIPAQRYFLFSLFARPNFARLKMNSSVQNGTEFGFHAKREYCTATKLKAKTAVPRSELVFLK